MSIGDLITYVCLAIALWYVPRYILRVYAPGLYARIKLSIENAVRELQERDYARYQAKQSARRYVTQEPVRDQFRTSSSGGFAGSGDPVLAQQNQAELQEPDENEPPREPFARQLAKEELIILLAVQRNSEGGYLYSANQITSFVGGAAAPIKAIIATVRGTSKPILGTAIKRPVNGW